MAEDDDWEEAGEAEETEETTPEQEEPEGPDEESLLLEELVSMHSEHPSRAFFL